MIRKSKSLFPLVFLSSFFILNLSSSLAQPVCPDTICDVEFERCPNTCPEDCEIFCGNGCCETGESSSACVDCFCGDGICDPDEDFGSCPDDCGICGDGFCLISEITCPARCAEDCPPSCGDGCCEGDDNISCPEDCLTCGDGVCEGAEDICPTNCFPDCPNGGNCDDGNLCTDDSCDMGGGTCVNAPVPEGTLCDDGNSCTVGDSCDDSGTCIGGKPIVCPDPDQCHQPGSCDPLTGLCSNPPQPNGTPCDDGNACTQTDSCQGGVCTGGDPKACTADQCDLSATCQPETGNCVIPPKPNGTPCDDGNACTQTDACQDGTCSGANATVCPTPDQCHLAGVCNPETGACTNPPKGNGTPCDDGNLCTQTDRCQAGLCVGANPITCQVSNQCHMPGTCDPLTGNCSETPAPDGSPCNDGNPCTQTDTCQGGNCSGANPVVCPAADQCHSAGLCDPQTGNCSNPPVLNGTPCNDGNACTGPDTCQAGVCAGSNPVICSALDQCHLAGVCDPQTGICFNPPKANGTACDDGNACTQGDSCQTGVCRAGSPMVCVSTDQCHLAGSCDTQTGACLNPPLADGTPCNDGNECSTVDVCQGGVCGGLTLAVDGTPCGPDQEDVCHAGSCEGILRVTGTAGCGLMGEGVGRVNPWIPLTWILFLTVFGRRGRPRLLVTFLSNRSDFPC